MLAGGEGGGEGAGGGHLGALLQHVAALDTREVAEEVVAPRVGLDEAEPLLLVPSQRDAALLSGAGLAVAAAAAAAVPPLILASVVTPLILASVVTLIAVVLLRLALAVFVAHLRRGRGGDEADVCGHALSRDFLPDRKSARLAQSAARFEASDVSETRAERSRRANGGALATPDGLLNTTACEPRAPSDHAAARGARAIEPPDHASRAKRAPRALSARPTARSCHGIRRG